MKKTNFIIIIVLFFILYPCCTWALPEICGNNIDEDNDGISLDCPEPDKDNDGFLSLTTNNGNDCDDQDYKIFPGVVTTKGCDSGQYHKCLEDGTYTTCSAEILCEAQTGSNCKYIDCTNGNDSTGDGSYQNPWKSFKMISAYENPANAPLGHYDPLAGDVIYLKGSGICSESFSAGSTYPNTLVNIRANGTANKPIVFKRYAGSTATLNPPFTATFPGHVIRVDSSSYLKFEDLDLTDSYSALIYITESKFIEISRIRCHDSQGSTLNNIACINAAGNIEGNYYHHNEIFNIYDPDNAGADNVSLIVMFLGFDNRIEYNRLYYTNEPNYGGPVIGRCFKYKHPSATGNLYFKGNQLWNCFHTAVENSTAGMIMQNNLLINPTSYSGAAAYHCGDTGGGTSYCRNALIEHNTFINMRAISYRQSVNSGLGITFIRYNVAVDNSSSYNTENGFYRIERYGSDQEFLTFLSQYAISPDKNCYYNPNTYLTFDFFGDSPTTTGGMYDFSAWQNYGYDSSSLVTNPQLNQYFQSTSPSCYQYGWNSTTLITEPTTSTTTSTSSTSTTVPTTTTSTTTTTTSTTTILTTTTTLRTTTTTIRKRPTTTTTTIRRRRK